MDRLRDERKSIVHKQMGIVCLAWQFYLSASPNMNGQNTVTPRRILISMIRNSVELYVSHGFRRGSESRRELSKSRCSRLMTQSSHRSRMMSREDHVGLFLWPEWAFLAQSEMSIYRTLVAIKLNSHGWSDPLTTTTNKAVIEGIGNVVVTRDSASPDS